VGNDTLTLGLLTTCPAATLPLKDAIKELRSGGQEHGIFTTCPAAFVIPSQSPVPVGLIPAWRPNWGTRLGSTPRLTSLAGAPDTDATRREEITKVAPTNFIVAGSGSQRGLQKMNGSVELKEC